MREQMIDAYQRGWSLIPLKANSKVPNLPKGHGFLYRKPSKEEYKGFDFGNYGIVCGKISGITVLDVDLPEGYDALQEREISLTELWTPTAHTPGGMHFFFKYNEGAKTGVAVLGKGVDIRNDGGYIVGPGSKVDTGEYKWVVSPDEAELTDVPEWLIKGKDRRIDVQPTTFFEKIGAGERNSKLVSLAGYLHYKFPTEIVEVLVQKVNDVWCEPPLDEEEVEDIVRKNYKQYHAGK